MVKFTLSITGLSGDDVDRLLSALSDADGTHILGAAKIEAYDA